MHNLLLAYDVWCGAKAYVANTFFHQEMVKAAKNLHLTYKE